MTQAYGGNGALEKIRRAATARGRSEQGLFAIEGPRLVWRALKAQFELAEVILGEAFALTESGAALADELRRRGVAVLTSLDASLLELSDGRSSGACVGLGRLPEPCSLDQWLARHGDAPALVLLAADVAEPGNVGALARTALASAVDVFVSQGVTDLFHPKAVRSSLGSVFKLPGCVVDLGGEAAAALRAAGFGQFGAVAGGGHSLPHADLSAPRLALYVGNEAQGLPDRLIAELDGSITIPMPSSLDSYSVNAAAAIVLYEARCQRRGRAPQRHA